MNLIEMRVERRNKMDARKGLKSKADTLLAKRDLSDEEKAQLDDVVSQVAALNSEVADLDNRIGKLEVLEQGEPAEADADPMDDGEKNGRSVRARQPFAFPNTSVAKKHEYDPSKLVRSLYGSAKLDGLEAEWHQELRGKQGTKHGGLMLPLTGQKMRFRVKPGVAAHFRSDFTTTTAAGSLVTHVEADVIEYLRANMVFTQMGATFLNGLEPGILQLSRQTGTATSAWVTEGNAPSASAADVSTYLQLVPQAIVSYTNITRQLMFQSAIPSIADFIKGDLVQSIAHQLDKDGLNGTGSNQPTGILNDSNITTYAMGTNGAAIAYSDLLKMEKTVAEANAERGALGYVTSPAGRATLKSTAKLGSTYPVFLWGDDNTINGVPAFASTQVPNNLTKGTTSGKCTAVVYGNWEDYVIAQWGEGVEIVEDPYSLATSGGKRIVALLDAAFGPRITGSFIKCVDYVY